MTNYHKDYHANTSVDQKRRDQEQYGYGPGGRPQWWNLWQGGPRYNAATGKSGLLGQQEALAKVDFGTKKPQEIATALTLEELQRMRTAPETFAPSEEEISDAGRQATASAGETAATAMQKALRESGTRTGTESALRGAQTDLGEVAQGTAAAVRGTAGKEVEGHMARIFGQLVGTPPPQPSALQTAMLDVGTGLVTDAGKLGVDYMREEQLGMESMYNKPGTTINVGGTATEVT